MKILAIRGKNLASLEGEFEVDFTCEPLCSAGIFAITGATGSGKSTLLDALCLALYDKTPRSNKALEDIAIKDVSNKNINQRDCRNILRRGTSDAYAQVDYISLSGEKYRSVWSVRRSRDKIDGSLQMSNISITNLSSSIEIQGTKTELLNKNIELTGLTFYQFTRTVLLAQGDFATFLKASQREKAELLEKLTGTEIYSQISQLIYSKAKAFSNETAAIRESIERIEIPSEQQIKEDTDKKEENKRLIEQINSLLIELNDKINWIKTQRELSKNVNDGEIYLNSVLEKNNKAKQRVDYLAKIDSVQQIRDSFITLNETIRHIDSNSAIISEKTLQIKQLQTQVEQLSDSINAQLEKQLKHNKYCSDMDPVIRQARDLDIKIIPAKESLEKAVNSYNSCKKNETELTEKINEDNKTLSKVEQTIEELLKWFEQMQPYQNIIPQAELIIGIINDAKERKSIIEKDSKILDSNQKLFSSQKERLEKLMQEKERLNSLMPEEIIVLRSKLKEGSPCPVCGSIHHPFEGVVKESLEEAKLNEAKQENSKEIELLSKTNEDTQKNIIQLKSFIESHTEQFNNQYSKLEAIFKDVSNWKTAFENSSLQGRIQKFKTKWDSSKENLDKQKAKQVELSTAITNKKESLESISKQLVELNNNKEQCQLFYNNLIKERKECLDIDNISLFENDLKEKGLVISNEIERLKTQKDKLVNNQATIKGTIGQITMDNEQLSKKKDSLNKVVDDFLKLKASSINRELLSELIYKDANWVNQERNSLNCLLEEKVKAQTALNERVLQLKEHNKKCKLAQGESIESLSIDYKAKQDLQSKLSEENAKFDVAIANYKENVNKLKELNNSYNSKREIQENWDKLNELLGSADGAKFKVLAQGFTLDTLIEHANIHLKGLTNRYQLQRIPDTLALEVADLDMLGQCRTVHSLSGGESFLVSLALALGLSSLSSSHLNVESLFIDEGFGSLDIDTLTIAMDALERLQMQGRKIGVISHVAEMTERIPVQIKVIKTSNGKSRIDIV